MENERKFDELCNKVRFCTRCARMEDSARVLSRAAGPLDAQIMFIGEAPGRLGADASEIPFHGDKSGHNFEEFLAFAGINRSKIFVTNSVLCNPKCESGNNSTPNKTEIHNCSEYLKQQLDLLNPRIVVTLGSVALDALNNIAKHHLRLTEHVRTVHAWYGRKLIPLYHPGARAMVHRSMANQRSDYQFAAEQLQRLDKTRREVSGGTKRPVAIVAKEIIRKKGLVSYFGLHKLLFLVECEAWSKLGHQLTGAFFLRQKDGPYCTDLHLLKLRKALPGLIVSDIHDRLVLRLPPHGMFDELPNELPADIQQIIGDVIESSATLSDAELKTKVYLTKPMRSMLRIEKTRLINLYNSPIKFETKSSIPTSLVHKDS